MVKWMKQPDFAFFSLSWTTSTNPPWRPQKNVVSDFWNEGNWSDNAILKENFDPILIRTRWIGRLELKYTVVALRFTSVHFGTYRQKSETNWVSSSEFAKPRDSQHWKTRGGCVRNKGPMTNSWHTWWITIRFSKIEATFSCQICVMESICFILWETK